MITLSSTQKAHVGRGKAELADDGGFGAQRRLEHKDLVVRAKPAQQRQRPVYQRPQRALRNIDNNVLASL